VTVSAGRDRPHAWVQELAAALSPEPDESPVPIQLTYPQSLPGKLDEDGTSLDEVAADLSSGATITRLDRGQGEFYRLESGRFSVNVNPSQARDSGLATATVTSVKLVRKVSRRQRLLACSVTFHPAFDEAGCDIAAVERLARERLAAQSKRRREASRVAGDWLAGAPAADGGVSYSSLHAQARQRYATLRNLFDLLEQHSMVAGGARATGTVAQEPAPGAPSLRVLIPPDGVTGRFPDNCTVQVQLAGEGRTPRYRLELRYVQAEDIVTEPPRAEIPPGTEVVVQYKPRFALERHQRALRDFLDAEVEGDWISLARLLIRPDALPALPGRAAPDTWYNPDLNAEQRAAVTGAVTTPHAYLIQGPPGTGKTTVICEIIQQLASRGERVLLLAPMHVAVDEVLRRVGDAHGITALRLAWDDQKVAPELRRFTPDNVAGEFGRMIRRPDRSRADTWQAQIAALEADQLALGEFVTARHQAQAATQALRSAQDRRDLAETAGQRAEQSALQADAEAARLEAAVTVAQRAAMAAQATAEGAAAQLASAERRHAAARQTAEEAAAAAVTAAHRARSSAADWQAAGRQAEHDIAYEPKARQARWLGQQAARAAEAEAARAVPVARARASAATADLEAATRRAAQAQQELDAVQSRRTWWSAAAAAVGRGELAEARYTWNLAAGDQLGAEGRFALSQREAEDAAAAYARAMEHTREVRRQTDEELRRAVQAALDAHAAEPQRAAMRSAAQAAARQADQARSHADSLTGPAAEAGAARQAAQQDHAAAASGAVAATRHAQDLARALTVARSAAGGARAAAASTAAVYSAARDAAAAAGGTADQLQHTAAQAGQHAARILGVESSALPSDENELSRHAQVLAAEADRLLRYTRLEERWFELIGAAAAQGADLRKLGDMLIGTANLVCCTTTGFGTKIVQEADFDTLIVDEASRVVDSEFLIGAVRARRWILVGDEHQLPPYLDQGDEHHLHAMAALHMTEAEPAGEAAPVDLPEAVKHLGELWVEDEELHQFRSESVLATAQQLRDSGAWANTYASKFAQAYQGMRSEDANPEREMLRAMRDHMVKSLFERCLPESSQRLRQRLVEQRRMIAPLAGIVSQPVYQGDYRSPPEDELARFKVTPLTGQTWHEPLVFFDTSLQPEPFDSREGTGFVNLLEARWAADICRQWEFDLRKQHADKLTVSILTFYRAQARIIRQLLGYPSFPGFRVLQFEVIDAIDRIQGQESDLVILSFCRTHRAARRAKLNANFGLWLQDLRRLNVACTRARRGLALVGHAPTLRALNGPGQAQEFYRHLFTMFDDYWPDTLMTREFIPVRPSAPGRPDEQP
jgi:hypothetical protein